ETAANHDKAHPWTPRPETPHRPAVTFSERATLAPVPNRRGPAVRVRDWPEWAAPGNPRAVGPAPRTTRIAPGWSPQWRRGRRPGYGPAGAGCRAPRWAGPRGGGCGPGPPGTPSGSTPPPARQSRSGRSGRAYGRTRWQPRHALGPGLRPAGDPCS